MSSLHRRDWLKRSSLAIAGFSISLPQIASAKEIERKHFYETGPIRLSSNENPYGPSPMARKAMGEVINNSNRYPWDLTTKLIEKLGEHHNLPADHVLLGAGSSEILGLAVQLAALNKGNAITAEPAFSSWVGAASNHGLEIIKVPLNSEKTHDFQSMLSKITTSTRLFYICNPNNPTGTILPSSTVRAAAETASRQAIVLIDEAYMEYSDDNGLSDMVSKNKNIIIAKTFSKIHGLAGARIGYALAHPDTIDKLGSLQPWMNAGVSAVSLAGAIASLDDKKFLSESKAKNTEARNFTEKGLKALGITVIPSVTNFIYYSPGSFKGNWQEGLRSRNILSGRVVESNGQWPRTTIGTIDEMKKFVAAAAEIMKGNG